MLKSVQTKTKSKKEKSTFLGDELELLLNLAIEFKALKFTENITVGQRFPI